MTGLVIHTLSFISTTGFSALQYITKGATKLFVTEFGVLFISTTSVQNYLSQKRGGFQQALKDFDSIVDPADVGRNFKVKGVVVSISHSGADKISDRHMFYSIRFISIFVHKSALK